MSSGNVATDILSLAQTHPERTAVAMRGESVCYAGLARAAGRGVATIRSLGTGEGDRVGIYMQTSPVWLATYLGLQDAGVTPVVLNAMLTRVELSDIVGRVDIRVVVVDPPRVREVEGLLSGNGKPVQVVVVDPSRPIELQYADAGQAPLSGNCGHDAVVMMTSGTTGRPKAAALTHTNMAFGTACASYSVGIFPGATVVTPAPLFYDMGIHSLSLTVLNNGGTMVLQDRFEEAAFVDLIEEHQPHIMAATPTVFLRIAAEGTRRNVRADQMQSCIAGGAAMDDKSAAQLARMFPNATVRQIYGMTEVRTVTGSRREQQAPSNSMGAVIPGVNLRLVDATGQTLTEPGQVGELAVHSPGVMRGYLSGEQDSFLPGGWMRTGDLATQDEAGWYYFSGRTKEMITRGGANVYPREIEEALATIEAIDEVAVIGQPHPDLGEVPVAYYVLAPGAARPADDTLEAVARERLAAYKVPVAFHCLPSLPRNAAGKVTKRRLVPPGSDQSAREGN